MVCTYAKDRPKQNKKSRAKGHTSNYSRTKPNGAKRKRFPNVRENSQMADEVDKVDINRSKPLRCVARLTLEYRNCGGDIWIWPTKIKLLTALVLNSRELWMTIIVRNFNAWAPEYGNQITLIRRPALLEALAELEVVVANIDDLAS